MKEKNCSVILFFSPICFSPFFLYCTTTATQATLLPCHHGWLSLTSTPNPTSNAELRHPPSNTSIIDTCQPNPRTTKCFFPHILNTESKMPSQLRSWQWSEAKILSHPQSKTNMFASHKQLPKPNPN